MDRSNVSNARGRRMTHLCANADGSALSHANAFAPHPRWRTIINKPMLIRLCTKNLKQKSGPINANKYFNVSVSVSNSFMISTHCSVLIINKSIPGKSKFTKIVISIRNYIIGRIFETYPLKSQYLDNRWSDFTTWSVTENEPSGLFSLIVHSIYYS